MPAPEEYNQVPPSKHRDIRTTQTSSQGRGTSFPNAVSGASSRANTASLSITQPKGEGGAAMKQSILQSNARTCAQNDSPRSSTSQRLYFGCVDSEVQHLFQSSSTSAWTPIALYSEDCLKGSLDTSFWDVQYQPYLTPPSAEQTRARLSYGISKLPQVAVVVPSPCIPPQEMTTTPLHKLLLVLRILLS